MGKTPLQENVPEIGEGKRGEAGYLGYLLRQAANAYSNRAERALSDLGITPPQFATLTMLAAYPGLSGAEIARIAILTPQTVSVIIANLEKRGAIVRHPHPVHGRIQTAELTDTGRTLLAAARKRVQNLEAELANGMTAAQEHAIRTWLVGVARASRAVSGSPPP